MSRLQTVQRRMDRRLSKPSVASLGAFWSANEANGLLDLPNRAGTSASRISINGGSMNPSLISQFGVRILRFDGVDDCMRSSDSGVLRATGKAWLAFHLRQNGNGNPNTVGYLWSQMGSVRRMAIGYDNLSGQFLVELGSGGTSTVVNAFTCPLETVQVGGFLYLQFDDAIVADVDRVAVTWNGDALVRSTANAYPATLQAGNASLLGLGALTLVGVNSASWGVDIAHVYVGGNALPTAGEIDEMASFEAPSWI